MQLLGPTTEGVDRIATKEGMRNLITSAVILALALDSKARQLAP